ncbi:type I polyketide synthase [Azospirillum sp. B506]|uniref:type I polyketide synthase n=1 Tax=Azospirillum sp. B506 TaxID=137721 RepID=UPI00034AE60B|nr:type I polyketide synthase [Azospirillum sp. B506]
MRTATLLAELGARHLVLVARRPPAADAEAAIAALEAAGCRAQVIQADIADAAAMQALVSGLSEGAAPLAGIIHAAGTLADATLDRQDAGSFDTAGRGKLLGALVLDAVTRDLDLDLFVLFSSAAALIGSAGQASYAAANAAMEALAARRAAAGQPALVIQWGAWADGGMAHRLGDQAQRRLGMRGMRPLPADDACRFLAAALVRPVGTLALLDIGWADYAATLERPDPLLSVLVPAARRTADGDGLRNSLIVAPEAGRRALLATHVRAAVRRVLGLAETDPLRDDQPLSALGFDSLASIELRDALARSTGLSLPATVAYSHPTVEALTGHIADRLLPEIAGAAAPAAVPAARPAPANINAGTADAIAIIGIGCRLPGGIDDPRTFWSRLMAGTDAVTEIPRDRWEIDAWYDPDPAAPGKISTRWMASLADIDRFDAGFFGIAPREARALDPQQRLLLEVAWEALEDAGLPADDLRGSRTGVFIGISASDYARRQLLSSDPRAIDAFAGTGTQFSATVGRISYTLGFQGPNMAIDTACSSSLVAIHLAFRSLRDGESDVALAGGVNLILSPENTVYFSKLGAMAPDGRCKPFDARGDGYVRGEGCGILVLKRLADALADGDPVVAVLRGSAVNQDGRSHSFTAPNGAAQSDVIHQALARARLDPAAIGYVEAHGTGTALGDPIEVEALGQVFAPQRDAASPLLLGSVKSNMGHLESAAGVAGVIKAALMVRHGMIPPTLHFRTPNPRISWDDLPIQVAAESQPWPGTSRRAAGVSAFGWAGTNAHVIVEEAPESTANEPMPEAAAPRLLVLSARSEPALRALAGALAQHLTGPAAPALADACFTAACRRSHHPVRAAVLADDRPGLAQALTSLAAGTADERTAPPPATPALSPGAPGIVFIFPGQGSQWLGMGRDLLAREPVFRTALETCDAAILAETGWSVIAELQAAEADARLGETAVVQPVLFALQVALAALWRSWGIVPAAVVGHSMGETAAAHVAGALSLAAAVRVICRRSRLLDRLRGQGAMALVELSLAEAQARLADWPGVEVAASNGPRLTVLSGAAAAVAALVADLSAAGLFARLVPVAVASHSAQVDGILDELATTLGPLDSQAPRCTLWSTVSGRPVTRAAALEADYWCANLRRPVLLAPVVADLAAQGHRVFIEISPHPVLVPAVQETVGAAGLVLASMRRDGGERAGLLRAAGLLYSQGAALNWSAIQPAGRCVTLPSYPWQRERFWLETPQPQSAHLPGKPLSGTAALLGRRLSSPLATVEFATLLRADEPALLAGHKVDGRTVVAGAAFAAIVSTAARRVGKGAPHRLRGLRLEQSLVLEADRPCRLRTVLIPQDDAPGWTVRIYSAPGIASDDDGADDWQLQADGKVLPGTELGGSMIDLAALRAGCPEERSGDGLYAELRSLGYHLDAALPRIARIGGRTGESLCLVDPVGGDFGDGTTGPHPGLIDSCFHAFAAALPEGPAAALARGRIFVPVEIRAADFATIGAAPRQLWVHARLAEADAARPEAFTGTLTLADDAGTVLATLDIAVRSVQRAALLGTAGTTPADWLYNVAWQALPQPAPAAAMPGRWLVLADRGGVGLELAAQLSAAGATVDLLPAADLVPDDDSGDWQAPLPGLAARLASGPPLRGIVHLPALDVDSDAFDPAAADPLCGTIVRLLRTLGGATPRLWLVTRNATAAHGERVAPVAAAAWGLGRVLAHEHPGLRPSLADLAGGPDDSPDQAGPLARLLLADGPETQIRLGPGGAQGARLVRGLPAGAVRPVPVRGDGRYLITGGTGALGIAIAEWLAGQGAGALTLIARSIPAGAAADRIAQLRARGIRVDILHADLADGPAVATALEAIRDDARPIRGVVHAAGILADGRLMDMDRPRWRAALAAKAGGALHLDRLSRDWPLDFFVLFSSAAALLGPPGQANYAAANAVLDALAAGRRAAGLPALSLAWGAWGEAGLATSAVADGSLAAAGIRAIAPEDGVRAFADLLGHDAAHLAVMPMDGRLWTAAFPEARTIPFYAALTVGTAAAPASRMQALATGTAAERLALLESAVCDHLAQVAGLRPEQIGAAADVNALGITSVMALELSRRLGAELGIKVPGTLVWSNPSPRDMARRLAGLLNLPEESASQKGTLAATVSGSLAAPAGPSANRPPRRAAAAARRHGSALADVLMSIDGPDDGPDQPSDDPGN